ncbi:hypothetical protein L1887_51978 [Cichorium endivia]|nr:hypothetical protein L1887_51978 [Cichorium endivia]
MAATALNSTLPPLLHRFAQRRPSTSSHGTTASTSAAGQPMSAVQALKRRRMQQQQDDRPSYTYSDDDEEADDPSSSTFVPLKQRRMQQLEQIQARARGITSTHASGSHDAHADQAQGEDEDDTDSRAPHVHKGRFSTRRDCCARRSSQRKAKGGEAAALHARRGAGGYDRMSVARAGAPDVRVDQGHRRCACAGRIPADRRAPLHRRHQHGRAATHHVQGLPHCRRHPGQAAGHAGEEEVRARWVQVSVPGRGGSDDRHGIRGRRAQHHGLLQAAATDAAVFGYDAQEDPGLCRAVSDPTGDHQRRTCRCCFARHHSGGGVRQAGGQDGVSARVSSKDCTSRDRFQRQQERGGGGLGALLEHEGELALAAVLAVLVPRHEDAGAALGRGALATEALDVAIAVHLVVLEDGHLDLLALVGEALGGVISGVLCGEESVECDVRGQLAVPTFRRTVICLLLALTDDCVPWRDEFAGWTVDATHLRLPSLSLRRQISSLLSSLRVDGVRRTLLKCLGESWPSRPKLRKSNPESRAAAIPSSRTSKSDGALSLRGDLTDDVVFYRLAGCACSASHDDTQRTIDETMRRIRMRWWIQVQVRQRGRR